MTQRQIFEYHKVIGYRFIPEIKARIPHESGGYLLRTNNWGFRCDHDFVRQKLPNQRRVLIFGDSFTAGDGVSNNKRYSDVLEERISDLEVYNLALPGTGTDQQYLAYQEFAHKIDHDLIIISVFVENIRRVVSHYRYYQNDNGEKLVYAKPYFVIENEKLRLKQCPPAKLPLPEKDLSAAEKKSIDKGGRFQALRKIIIKAGVKDIAQRISRYQPVPEYDNPKNPAWKILSRILESWIHQHSKPVILMPLPLYQFTEGLSNPSGYQARFIEIASETGCTLHDPLPDLLQYPIEKRRSFRFDRDIHLTPEGHIAVANSLAPVVEKVLDGFR